MSPNDADGMANSVDHDQAAPRGSGSALFAQAYLSENLGSLRYLARLCTTPKVLTHEQNCRNIILFKFRL